MSTAPGRSAATTTSSPPTAAAELSTDRARKARPDELKVLTTIPGMSGRTRQGVLALSPRGQALVGVNPPPATGELMAQSRLQVVDRGKHSWLPSTPTEARPRQAFDGSMPGDSTAAWLETRSTDVVDTDWRVFGWSKGNVRLLAESDSFAERHRLSAATGAEHLASDGENVWWSYLPAGGEPSATDIATADLAAASPPRVVVKGAHLPTVDPRGGLVYVRDPFTAPHTDGYDIHLLRGTRDEILFHGTVGSVGFISALCVGRGAVAWAIPAETEDPGGQIVVMDRSTRSIRTIRLRDSARGPDLVCGDGFVAWGNGSGNGDAGQYLWSLKTGALVKLGESFGISGVVASGRYVAWTLPPASPQASADTRLARWNGG